MDETSKIIAELRARNAELEEALAERDRRLEQRAALAEEELSTYRLFFELATDGIFVSDDEGRYTHVNPAGCAMLGYTEDELCQLNLRDLMVENDRKARPPRLDELRAGAAIVSVRQLKRKDGSLVTAEIHARALPKAGGFQSIVRDVTRREQERERREREESEQLEAQKMEMVGRLAGGIAHDFNNLLTVVMSGTHLLRLSTSLDGEARKRIDEIESATQRAADLTSKLLAFGRKQHRKPESLHLHEVIDDLETLLQSAIGEKGTLCLELDRSAPAVWADRTQLEQVLLNLAVNARDALVGTGLVRIATAVRSEDESQWVELSVSDNGAGIPDEVLPHIFDPYFSTKGIGGSGLGLSTVQGIVAQSEGHLRVETSPEHGTTFEILLPVSASPAPRRKSPAARSTGTPSPETRASILVCEDDPSVRRILGRLLQDGPWTVAFAESGEKGLALARASKTPFDLLLSDVVMPGMSGLELADVLRKEQPTLPVILISGFSEQVVSRAEKPGFEYDFLRKPFDVSKLLELIRVRIANTKQRSR